MLPTALPLPVAPLKVANGSARHNIRHTVWRGALLVAVGAFQAIEEVVEGEKGVAREEEVGGVKEAVTGEVIGTTGANEGLW